MEKNPIYQWCREATSKIRYYWDRKAVYEELLQHAEDKYDALAKAGVPQADIPEQVLLSMGSAEEIAPQLAALHRPFWGYLHFLTKLIVILILPAFLFVLCWQTFRFATDSIYAPPDYSRREYDPYIDTSAPEMQRFHYAEPNLVYLDSGYHVKLSKVSCWRGVKDVLYIRLEVTGMIPLCDHPDFCYYIGIRDNLGNEYTPARSPFHIAYNSEPRRDVVQTGQFSWICDTEITDCRFDDMEWIELYYIRDGRNMTMRVPIPGGSAS